jgi:hypothetical protein
VLYDFIGLLEEDEVTYFWFQKDGAFPHTADSSVKLLNEILGRVISTNLWPPRSPDLTPAEQQDLQCIVTAHARLMISNLQ